MAIERPDDSFIASGLSDVEITIEVEPGRGRTRLAQALTRSRSRLALVLVGVSSAGVAGVILSGGSGTIPHPTRVVLAAPTVEATPSADQIGTIRPFGIRAHCVRRTIVSPNGEYARVDFERATTCGTAGNHVTLILHRVRGVWVAEFDATGWRCRSGLVPGRILAQLNLCGTATR
jgi:hypothetical protein